MSIHYHSINFEMRDGKAETVAHVRVFNKSGVFWLTDLWVAPDLRGQGRARELMDAAIADQGYRTLYMEVSPYADQPIPTALLAAWYARWGFRPTDVPNVLRRESTP